MLFINKKGYMKNNFLTYRDFLKSDLKKPDLIFTIKTCWFIKIWQEEKKKNIER